MARRAVVPAKFISDPDFRDSDPLFCPGLRIEAHLQSLIAYFSAHPLLALAAVFAASFLESLALIGTVVPGSTIVFVGGVLVGLHALDPWWTAAVAIGGAIAGDGISYWLGQHYHQAIRATWPLRRYPALFERGEAYFAANGGKSVFLGRFFGPVRAIVPIVAGMSNMPAAHFYAMNVLSALAWAAAHLVPGVLFGASLQLAGAVSSRLVVLLALTVVALWLIAAVLRFALRWGLPRVKSLRERILARANGASGPVARIVLPLLDPARREPFALLIAAVLLVGGAWIFLGVVEDVVTDDTLVDVDRAMYQWLQGLRTGWGDDLMVTVTQLGSAWVTIPVIAAVALWLAVTRRLRTLAYWIGSVVVAELFVAALKYALGRERPPTPYASVDEFSFPSGHATLNLVVYGFLAFLLGHGKPRWQQSTLALAAAGIALLIGFSRLYLGAHWFSDVLAGYGLGIAWIALLSIAYIHHVHERRMRTAPVIAIVAATLTFVGGSYAGDHHERDLARYAKPATMRTLALGAWRDGGWRSVPAARTEVSGDHEEPFSVQWVGTAQAITEALAGADWQAPPAWKSSAALLWLLPSTPLAELPVLPKLYQGRAPPLTFVRAVDAHARYVARLWPVANAVDDANPPRTLPLWAGMVTMEQARSEFGLLQIARTTKEFVSPDRALAGVAQAGRAAFEARPENGRGVLLMW